MSECRSSTPSCHAGSSISKPTRQAGQPLAGRSQVRLLLPGRALKWLEVGDASVPWDGAQALLLFFLFFGRSILDLFGLSDSSLNIAGGVILFLIAIRLIFQHPEGAFGTDSIESEPFIVPLAIPSIAGPSAIATIVLVVSRSPERITDWIMALAIASTITLLLLLAADRIARHIGRRGLAALDRMMGLILTAIAVEMLLKGIESFVRGL